MGLNVSIKIGIVGLVGALLCAGGGVLYAIFPGLIKSKIKQNLKIQNGTETFKAWSEAPIPIYMQYYIFNVTNHQDVLKKKSKPELQQLGPYTYREYRKKVDIEFHEENDTVSYRQIKWFVYEPSMTRGSLDDVVVVPNLPLVSMAGKTEGKLDFFKKLAINSFINRYKAGVFVIKTVNEILFEGYKDELMIKLAEQSKRQILPNGTFGFFYGQNYTDDGLYSVYTGVQDPDKFAFVESWNNYTTLPYWDDQYCDMINGSDGSQFTPFLKKDATIRLFSTDLCRSLYMTFDEETTVRGIRTYRFSPPFSLLADRTLNPDNECFCKDADMCALSGLLNISTCKQGAPVIVSPPHFYQTDTKLLDDVVGLHPDKDEHSTVLDIEPTTGVVLRAARRLQMNVRMKPMDHLTVMKNAPDILFPVLWVNESAHIDADRAEKFKAKVFTPMIIGQAVTYALIGIGAFVLLCALLFAIHFTAKKKSSQKYEPAPNGIKAPTNISKPIYDPVRPIYEPAAESLLEKSPSEPNHVRA